MKTITRMVSILTILAMTVPVAASAATRRRTYDGGEGFGRSMSDWRRGNSELRNKINSLDSDSVEDLPIPVLFGVAVRNLSKNFGDDRGDHKHEGLDIMAAEGLPIVTPTEAVVIRTGDGSSSGNYVTTANPGGESFVYMHLSEIADINEGDVLEPGDLIGYVGHTGNAVASAPHLHLEIHDEDGDATDPFPRLTEVFDLDDKIEYLEQILKETDDEEELAELLVQKSRADFTAAVAQDIDLPEEIEDAMKKIPASVANSSVTANSSVLKVGSTGPKVVDLQNFLIKQKIGSYKNVTADGAFGPKTRQALIDYQQSVGLTADGVAGPKTLAYIATHD